MSPPYARCGFLGVGRTSYDMSNACGDGTALRDGRCVSIVDVTADNAAMCGDGTALRGGRCVSIVDVTADNAAMCDTPGIEYRNGRCAIRFSDDETVSNMIHKLNGGEFSSTHWDIEEMLQDRDWDAVPRSVNCKASCEAIPVVNQIRQRVMKEGWREKHRAGIVLPPEYDPNLQ